MPLNLLQAPNDLVFIGECFQFVLRYDPPTVTDTDVRVGYQLVCDDADETPATKPKYFTPKTIEGQDFSRYPINFDRQVRSRLSTKPPMLDVALHTAQDNPGFKKKFKLKFWEEHIGIGEGNCGTRSIENERTSSGNTAINSALQWYDEPNGLNDIIGLVTSRPECVCICKDACDFLYFCNRSQFSITGSLNGQSYQIGSSPLLGTAGKSGCIKIKPYDEAEKGYDFITGFLTDLEGNQVPVFLGQPFETITYTIGDKSITYKFKCCCDEHRNIYFQESGGGYAVMSLCCLEGITNTTTSEEICLYNDCYNVTSKESRLQNGDTIYQKTAQETIAASTKLSDSKETRRWTNEFLNSKSYFIEDCDRAGDPRLVKFKLLSGAAQIFGRQTDDLILTLQGVIDNPFMFPNNRFNL